MECILTPWMALLLDPLGPMSASTRQDLIDGSNRSVWKLFVFSRNTWCHIIIIIMSCRLHGYPWTSLATSLCRSSPLASLLGYIPYCHKAAVCTRWSSSFCSAICGEYITYELDPASPAVSCVSGSSNLDIFWDGRQVTVYLVPCGVLPPGLVQYCSQHSCVIAV